MMKTRRIVLAAATISVAGLAPSTGIADEARPASSLPGVDTTYSIVAPAPEPAGPPTSPGTTAVGKWELTVSGYVWVQAGASSARGN